MNNGYVKLHRKLLDWEWYQDANTFRLFLHLLMRANHKDGKWQGYDINRGQLITGRKILSVELKISERSIRTAFDHLIKTRELTIKATNKHTLVTLVNYDSYQSDVVKTTSKLPTIDQLLTTNKNVKNVKNIRRVIDNVSGFEEKWNEYASNRVSIKKKMTPLAANMALKTLVDFHDKKINVIEVMNNSISNGWSGLFEPKKKFESFADKNAIPQPKSEEQRKADDEAHWRRLGYNSEAEYSKGEFDKQMERLNK